MHVLTQTTPQDIGHTVWALAKMERKPGERVLGPLQKQVLTNLLVTS